MKHFVVRLLALIALACSLPTTVHAESFAKRVDIGGGRMMYIECHGSGSPTVLLISGTDAASDLWHAADQKGPTVYDDIQKTTRVCAYDRPDAMPTKVAKATLRGARVRLRARRPDDRQELPYLDLVARRAGQNGFPNPPAHAAA